MLITKMGFEHMLAGVNCQDFSLDTPAMKCVVDGCSEGLNSEVGTKLFIYFLKQGLSIEAIFERLVSIFPHYQDIRNHLLFTILLLKETETEFVVQECGDGFIILQRHDDTFEYEKIDYNGIPPYYAYNYIGKEHLSLYAEGVRFNIHRYTKTEYKAVGIASDGVEYILKSDFKEQFEKHLRERKIAPIKRLINRNSNYQYIINNFPLNVAKQGVPFGYNAVVNNFKDDISVVI